VSSPTAARPPPVFGTGCTTGCVPSMTEGGVLETHPANGATRFPGGDSALAASSSTAEGGLFESQRRVASHPLAAEPDP
jgi:hypothetical protein